MTTCARTRWSTSSNDQFVSVVYVPMPRLPAKRPRVWSLRTHFKKSVPRPSAERPGDPKDNPVKCLRASGMPRSRTAPTAASPSCFEPADVTSGSTHNPFLIEALLIASQDLVEAQYGVGAAGRADYNPLILEILKKADHHNEVISDQ